MDEKLLEFKTYSKVLHIIGDRLVSNDNIAIFELIKNSFDANATEVSVIFKGKLKKGHGSIVIRDNGHGMTIPVIENAWMGIATDYKENLKKKGQDLLGDKGIGRFASSRLAETMELSTRPVNMDEEYHVKFKWEEIFENRLIDEVRTQLKITNPMFFPDNSGTVIHLLTLRADWDEKKIEEMKFQLSKLINPLEQQVKFNINLEFSDDEFKEFSGRVEPSKIIDNPHYKIKGSFKDNKIHYSFEYHKFNQSEFKEFQKQIKKVEIPKNNSKFDFEIRAWDLTDKENKDLKQKMNISLKDIRQTIRLFSGICIYKNNFRVLPYGETQNDWLNLSQRRQLKYGEHFGKNQLIGYISFKEKENPELKEQSNREGFDNNKAFNNLLESVLLIITQLENKGKESKKLVNTNRKKEQKKIDEIKRDLDRVKKKKEEVRKKQEKRNLKAFQEIKEQIRNISVHEEIKKIPDIQKTLDSIVKKSDKIKKEIEESSEKQRQLEKEDTELSKESIEQTIDLKDDINEMRGLITLGLMGETLVHDGSTNISKLASEINKIKKGIEERTKKFQEQFENIFKYIDSFETLFSRINPLTKKDFAKIKEIHMKLEIKQYMKYWIEQLEVDNISIKIDSDKANIFVKMRIGDFYTILMNLLNNSIYWLKRIKRKRIINIQIKSLTNRIQWVFSDNGPGIKEENFQKIFRPYFSTKTRGNKQDGWGLGLFIVKEIVETYNGRIFAMDQPMNGANIYIEFPIR